MTYATVDPLWLPATEAGSPRRRYRDVNLGRCHLLVEEVAPAVGVIVSMSSSDPADYLLPYLLPGAAVVLPPEDSAAG
ncbi:MAG: YlzJ-like family protein [Firmicutes bacterium]|nr:YlzJ-like family protein [Bacillota bacterium]